MLNGRLENPRRRILQGRREALDLPVRDGFLVLFGREGDSSTTAPVRNQ